MNQNPLWRENFGNRSSVMLMANPPELICIRDIPPQYRLAIDLFEIECCRGKYDFTSLYLRVLFCQGAKRRQSFD